MFNSIDGGTVIDVQGLKCNIPPVGYVCNRVSNQLDYIGVYRRSDNDKDCFWEVPSKPIWYAEVMKKWDNYDKIKKDDDDDFTLSGKESECGAFVWMDKI
jgi:hypothetical protein